MLPMPPHKPAKNQKQFLQLLIGAVNGNSKQLSTIHKCLHQVIATQA